MKVKQKANLTFGDLIASAYRLWGSGQAEKMVRLAVNARLIVFREPLFPLIFSTKGRST